MDVVMLLASIVAAAPPLIFAVLGETIGERAGVINLSLDGSLLLSAMAGFVAAAETGSVLAGFAAAALVGSAMAFIVVFASVTLRQSQVATGFVLTLLGRDLAYVLGNRWSHVPGPQVAHLPVAGLQSVPAVGPVLFDHNLVVYASLIAVAAAWGFLYRTQPGLNLRAMGEHPAAAYARGVAVTRMRYLYTMVGGALVGIGGAGFSLLVKPGWARPYGIEGTGWIALAIVIFGGWRPVRVACGAYLFVALQTLANTLQGALPGVPMQLFTTLPFPLMIFALLVVSLGQTDWANRHLARFPAGVRAPILRLLAAIEASPPAALGRE
jgi:ABC-type uncharacterized transport system permease subunit